MSGEVQISYQTGQTLYFVTRDGQGRPWSTSGGTGGFDTYLTASFPQYAISMSEQGVAGAYYVGSFPVNIPAGDYSVVAKQQAGGSPLETDRTVGNANVHWDGSQMIPLSSLANSGVLSQIVPLRIARGTMVKPFPFKLVSDLDNKTPFTSGVVSGQISRDGGPFGPLQSGAFTETGLGWYSLQALTSGDLNANSCALVFTANGVSGGQAAQRDFGFVLQRSSGVP